MVSVALRLLVGVAASGVAALSAALLVIAQTWTGRAIALLGLAVAMLTMAAYLVWRESGQRRLWKVTAVAGALVTLALLAGILANTPGGVAPNSTRVQHRFTTPARFSRFSLSNIVPEIEQVNLGFLLMTWLDPLLTRAQAARVAPFTMELYREMERDPDFRALGSAMGFAYEDLLGRRDDPGHYYLYVPRQRGAEPLPALIFLHGSAGNFKTYTWLWSKLAEERGMVVIAPSFGFGDWRRPEGATFVLAALEDAAAVVEIDPQQVYLAGLSNGGLGVSQLAVAAPERFAGLIFLSPVMNTSLLQSQAFRDGWAGRPVLVLTGEADERIPYAYVQRHVALLEASGAAVTARSYAGEDHFLVFSQPETIRQDVSQWLTTAGLGR